jgi:cell wall-associated NlpC family hydrolase
MKIGAIIAAVLAALVVAAAVPFIAFLVFVSTMGGGGGGCGGPATLTADGSPTILGPSTLTAAGIAGWWQSSGHGTTTPIGVDAATLAGWYVDHGTAEGVRGDLAFAQAVEETGYFASPAAQRNNFAGIGITGSGVNGYDFATPEAGVVAQLQLLKEVVSGNGVGFAEPRVAPTWGGRPASTWAGLAGNWAAATNYWDPAIKTIYASMTAAGGAPQPGTPATLIAAPGSCSSGEGVGLPVGGNLARLWTFLAAQLGKPYQWGATGPDSWDCSGLMMVAWEQVGLRLPRTAADQYAYTQAAAVPLTALQPGDLVFWGPSAPAIEHVAIYVGNGQILDAPDTGSTVQVQQIWTDGLFGATRPASGVPAPQVLVAQ